MDLASFSIGLAVGGWLTVLGAMFVTWWRRGRYQEPIWKNGEHEDEEEMRLEP